MPNSGCPRPRPGTEAQVTRRMGRPRDCVIRMERKRVSSVKTLVVGIILVVAGLGVGYYAGHLQSYTSTSTELSTSTLTTTSTATSVGISTTTLTDLSTTTIYTQPGSTSAVSTSTVSSCSASCSLAGIGTAVSTAEQTIPSAAPPPSIPSHRWRPQLSSSRTLASPCRMLKGVAVQEWRASPSARSTSARPRRSPRSYPPGL